MNEPALRWRHRLELLDLPRLDCELSHPQGKALQALLPSPAVVVDVEQQPHPTLQLVAHHEAQQKLHGCERLTAPADQAAKVFAHDIQPEWLLCCCSLDSNARSNLHAAQQLAEDAVCKVGLFIGISGWSCFLGFFCSSSTRLWYQPHPDWASPEAKQATCAIGDDFQADLVSPQAQMLEAFLNCFVEGAPNYFNALNPFCVFSHLWFSSLAYPWELPWFLCYHFPAGSRGSQLQPLYPLVPMAYRPQGIAAAL
jgi:hypothetical protein